MTELYDIGLENDAFNFQEADELNVLTPRDAQAISTAFSELAPTLTERARRYTKDHAAAEDITSEAFLKVCAALERGTARSDDLAPSLHVALTHLLIDRGRSAKIRTVDPYPTDLLPEPRDRPRSLESEVVGKVTAQATLKDIQAKLNICQIRVLAAGEIGITDGELAAEANVKVVSIRTRRHKLQKKLGQQANTHRLS